MGGNRDVVARHCGALRSNPKQSILEWLLLYSQLPDIDILPRRPRRTQRANEEISFSALSIPWHHSPFYAMAFFVVFVIFVVNYLKSACWEYSRSHSNMDCFGCLRHSSQRQKKGATRNGSPPNVIIQFGLAGISVLSSSARRSTSRNLRTGRSSAVRTFSGSGCWDDQVIITSCARSGAC